MEQYQKRNGTYLQRADLDLDALTPLIEWLGVFHVSTANITTSIHIPRFAGGGGVKRPHFFRRVITPV